MTGRLSGRVVELCDAAAAQSDPTLADHANAIATALADPLRLAVAGRVSSGKSTLVNALLGRRVAPTRLTECTRLVTWYRYGPLEKVVVHRRDGSQVTTRLASDGRLPERIDGVAERDVARLEVFLPIATLERLVLIDTPGLAALGSGNSARTEDALGLGDTTEAALDAASVAAAERAEAVLFVLPAYLRADERDAIRAFRRMAATVGFSSPVNALAVLTMADRLSEPGDDPWPAADRLADDFRSRLARDVTDVEPLAGLIAETVEAGAFTEADADALAVLAALDDRELRRLFRSADTFASREAGLSVAIRTSLLDRLGLYGIEAAVADVRAGSRSASALIATLQDRCRIRRIRETVTTTFTRRADVLKASIGLERLRRLSYSRSIDPDTRSWLADRVEELRFDPELHAIDELAALGQLMAGDAQLPTPLHDAFTRVVDGADVRADTARELISSLTAFAFAAAPADASVARTAARAIELRSREGSRP